MQSVNSGNDSELASDVSLVKFSKIKIKFISKGAKKADTANIPNIHLKFSKFFLLMSLRTDHKSKHLQSWFYQIDKNKSRKDNNVDSFPIY